MPVREEGCPMLTASVMHRIHHIIERYRDNFAIKWSRYRNFFSFVWLANL